MLDINWQVSKEFSRCPTNKKHTYVDRYTRKTKIWVLFSSHRLFQVSWPNYSRKTTPTTNVLFRKVISSAPCGPVLNTMMINNLQSGSSPLQKIKFRQIPLHQIIKGVPHPSLPSQPACEGGGRNGVTWEGWEGRRWVGPTMSNLNLAVVSPTASRAWCHSSSFTTLYV